MNRALEEYQNLHRTSGYYLSRETKELIRTFPKHDQSY